MDPLSSSSLTRLDRSLQTILDRPDDTPSRKAGISARVEQLHRLHGTSLIFEVSSAASPPPSSSNDDNGSNSNYDDHDRSCTVSNGNGLALGPSTVATACAIFHRFYHSASLTEYDVWSVAMASTLLATKIEEEPKTLKQIIDEFAIMYARRLILASHRVDDVHHDDNDDRSDDETRILKSPHIAFLSQPTTQWSSSRKQSVCTVNLPKQLNKFGAVCKEWFQQISKMEYIVLRQLGFTVYWIPDAHPHKFILYFCQVLELKDDKKFTQRAWNYCNDSCRLDLSVRFPPEVIACSAVLLAARDLGTQLPTRPMPWWQVFLGDSTNKAQNLATAANAILGLCRLRPLGNGNKGGSGTDDDESVVNWFVASKGFVRSLVKCKEPVAMGMNGPGSGSAFNDPGSFLWEYQNDLFDKESQRG